MVINKINLNKPNIFEFKQIVNEICQNPKVKEMTNFMQHANTSCYEHCLRVAYYTYIICKKLNLDYVSATRGAMLHDFFLYDWHEHRKVNSFLELHAFSHPKIALNVEHYKEKRVAALERLAVRIAKEVRATKTDAVLDDMNSYERRVIHNKLSNFKGVSTVSEGTEPHRHIIIKAE